MEVCVCGGVCVEVCVWRCVCGGVGKPEVSLSGLVVQSQPEILSLVPGEHLAKDEAATREPVQGCRPPTRPHLFSLAESM